MCKAAVKEGKIHESPIGDLVHGAFLIIIHETGAVPGRAVCALELNGLRQIKSPNLLQSRAIVLLR